MFKLLALTALLACGFTSAASDLDFFIGYWKVAEVWPADAEAGNTCDSLKFENFNTTTKCGDKVYPVLKLDDDDQAVIPAIIVQTYAEVAEALKTKCDDYENIFILRKLTDNYFTQTSNTLKGKGPVTLLWTKTVPTDAELAEFTSKIDGLKEAGIIVCTQEKLASRGN